MSTFSLGWNHIRGFGFLKYLFFFYYSFLMFVAEGARASFGRGDFPEGIPLKPLVVSSVVINHRVERPVIFVRDA